MTEDIELANQLATWLNEQLKAAREMDNIDTTDTIKGRYTSHDGAVRGQALQDVHQKLTELVCVTVH